MDTRTSRLRDHAFPADRVTNLLKRGMYKSAFLRFQFIAAFVSNFCAVTGRQRCCLDAYVVYMQECKSKPVAPIGHTYPRSLLKLLLRTSEQYLLRVRRQLAAMLLLLLP